ncbi:hypothetical protein JOB18_024817 [Solea senegalensis]|uniref:Uncharacterized protein n=1 Tax=Solea senegalensis TaxID=28829 RepID=A0AAV6RR04_SOLSE|nr:hypothetical protein JOB18_024817 [Solea senegalensis]
MENWRIHLAVVTFCALLQICQGLTASVEEERGLSPDWQDESLDPRATLMKRSKSLRFYGLMGKRSDTKKPFQVNRRNKGETFVGLMGRSISGTEPLTRINPSETISEFDVSEKQHEHGSPEEWIQILY